MKLPSPSVVVFSMASFFISCSNAPLQLNIDEEYRSARINMSRDQTVPAIDVFEIIIDEQGGSKYADYARLKIADALVEKGTSEFFEDSSSFSQAKENYNSFLRYNQKSHLVPYVLRQLLLINILKSKSGFFTESTNPQPFKDIINDYYRYYLLYPDSPYLDDIRPLVHLASQKIAQHELGVADWYFEQKLYASAIARYLYILRNFPSYEDKELVSQKLIFSFEKSQRREIAKEMKNAYLDIFGVPFKG